MLNMWKLLLVPALALGLASCSSDSKDQTSEMTTPEAITEQSLAGTWKLTGVAGNDGVIEDLPEGEMTVEGGRYSFSAGCNQMAGEVAVDDGQVKTEAGVTTLMECEGVLGQVDGVASQTLADVQSATLTEGGELTLVGPGGSLTFQRQ